MQELDVIQFYEKCLLPMTPDPIVSKILMIVMTGGETSEDFAKLLALDSEIQHWVRLTVQRLGFDKHSNRLLQSIILLGQNRIRDLILGRSMERSFYGTEDTVLGKLIADREKARLEQAKKAPTKPKIVEKTPEILAEAELIADGSTANIDPLTGLPEPMPPATPATDAGKTLSKSGDKSSDKTPDPEESELVPPIAEFQKYLEFAVRAEETAIAIRNSYPGQAFAGGVVFDLVRHYLKKQKITGLVDSRLSNTGNFLEEVFRDGIRCGIAANEIMQKISIPHQKNVFVSALVHNIGKPLLLIYDAPSFEKAFLLSSGAKEKERKIHSMEAEEEVFLWDHAQAGSLFMGRLPFLADIERSIDYHHNPHLLKFSNPKLYALACVLRVSAALVKLYQKSRQEDPDTDKIRDQRLMNSEDFAFLRLTPEDWSEVKSNYALKLMKVGY